MKKVIEEMGNPFMENGDDLLILDTRDVNDDNMKKAVLGMSMLGQEQFDVFVKNRLKQQTLSIDEPIKLNQIP